MFRKKQKQQPVTSYLPPRYEAVLRCSICTGEQTAGFRDTETGAFHEVMLIRDQKDLEDFQSMYQVQELRKIY